MNDLDLEPQQLMKLEQAIEHTRMEAHREVSAIVNGYQGIYGTAARGRYITAAVNKQDEFQRVWSGLGGILDALKDGMRGTRNLMASHDEEYEAAQRAISADDGAGSAMASNYGSRL